MCSAREEGEEGDLVENRPTLHNIFAGLIPRSMFNFFFFKGEELANELLKPGATGPKDGIREGSESCSTRRN